MTMAPRRLISTAALAVLASAVLLPNVSRAAVGDLYAATGSGGGGGYCGSTTLSTLYKIDPTDGSATLVGTIEIDDVQVRHVTALAFHPSTGVLYGVMNFQVAGVDCDKSTLITIDPANGEATIVGTQGSIVGPIPDIAFDPFGTLYGWSEEGDDLVKIDIDDGTASVIFSNTGTSQTGLADDSNGRLFLKPGQTLVQLNPFTGEEAGFGVNLDRSAQDVLAFDQNDVMFSLERNSGGMDLFTIDPETGTTTLRGSNTITNVSALTFDRGVLMPPPVADLRLEKEVDVTAPYVGDNVVFTLTLHNDGPDTAENVVVYDGLPFRLSFVSATGDGSYDDSTGEWTVTSIADGASAIIEITAEAIEEGEWGNVAEVYSSDSYDPDSVPGAGDDSADTYARVDGESVKRRLFSIDRDENLLWLVDPTLQDADAAQDITLAGHSVCGGNGLAEVPGSDTLFAVLQIDDCNTRTLATIDPATALATEIGGFGSVRIAAIASGASAGTLYGTSGNNGDQQHTLFTIDPSNGDLTAECILPDSNGGRALAFGDGLLYDATWDCTGDCQMVINVIDPDGFPVDPADPCPLTRLETGVDAEPTGMTVKEIGMSSVTLYVSSFSGLYEATIPGSSDPIELSQIGFMLHSSKGLVFPASAVLISDVSVTKSAVKNRVKGDKFITYVLDVNNSGPNGTNVELTDEIPFGTTFVSVGPDCNLDGGVVVCNRFIGAQSGVQLFEFTVQVTCKKCSSVVNQVFIEALDAYDYPFDNSSTINTQVKGKF